MGLMVEVGWDGGFRARLYKVGEKRDGECRKRGVWEKVRNRDLWTVGGW